MSKRQRTQNGYVWIEDKAKGVWSAVFNIAGSAFKTEPRPEPLFYPGEREGILFTLQNELSKTLFGQERYITNDQGKFAENPLWADLKVYEEPASTIVGMDGQPIE